MRKAPGRRSSPPSDAAWLAARSLGPCPRDAVFLHAPSAAFQAPGGGENQLVQTARHLEALGVRVRPFAPWTDRLEAARLLHLFGMSREGLDLARLARSRGVPVVISPICWYQPRAIWNLEPTLARTAAGLLGWGVRSVLPGFPSWRRDLLDLADAVLPGARAEADQLARLFDVPQDRLHVVPNGVLPAFGTATPDLFLDRWGPEPFVLSVGRIEPRKNSLGLVRALRGLGLPMVHFGDAVPGHGGYAAECRHAGEGLATWLGPIDHDDPLLASAYAAARVFALPSWFETPGLAALEAALAGCAVAVTPFGSTREYFGDLAAYARPDRPGEIRRAIESCWDRGPDSRLAPRIASHYLWPIVAQITAEVYDQVAR